jgi:hypothetical protein
VSGARKINIPAPMRVKTRGAHWMKVENDAFVTAPEIMYDEVTSRADCKGVRGCSAVCVEVEADLLRFAALNGYRVEVGIRGSGQGLKRDGQPFFYFPREMARLWLEHGGRTWILAELATRRSSARIVAFPSGGGPQPPRPPLGAA